MPGHSLAVPPGYYEHYGVTPPASAPAQGPIQARRVGLGQPWRPPPGYLQFYGIGSEAPAEPASPVQAKDIAPAASATSQAATPGHTTAFVQQATAQGISGSSGPLPYIDQIQRSFGQHDVSHIQAHTDSRATESARAIGAEAFATGEHVVFAGPPSLHTAAHEAAHVIQQRAGVQLKGGVGEVGDRYEQHADAVADLVVQGRSAEGLLGPWSKPAATVAAPTGDIQGKAASIQPTSIQLQPSSTPITSDVHQRVTETISNASAANWNHTFFWDSKFHLSIDPAAHMLIVSVRIYTTASAEVKKKWKVAIEGKWSNRYSLIVAGEKPDVPATHYPVTIWLEFVNDVAKADYHVRGNSLGAQKDGRAGLSGTTGMVHWGTGDTVDTTHEFGHMLGNHDDYFTTNGHDYTRGGKLSGFRDEGGGVMNNPSEDPFARHYDLIRQRAASALKVAVSRCIVEPAATTTSSPPSK